MSRSRQEDIEEIIELFEKELNSLCRIPKVERMKPSGRFVNVLKPALSFDNPRQRVIPELVEDKLSDVLKQFRGIHSKKAGEPSVHKTKVHPNGGSHPLLEPSFNNNPYRT